MKYEDRLLGEVIRADSNVIEILMTETIPSSSPIIFGKVYRVGQIGALVKIPIGNIIIYGSVNSISNQASKSDEIDIHGRRFLTIDLIGEKIGNKPFEKGVGIYPTIGEKVYLVTDKDLFDIYGGEEKTGFKIGTHSSSSNLPIMLDTHKFVLRHSAILGSTGSGKSNTTVGILKSIIKSYPNSRTILIDPHGEYSSAFPDAHVVRVGDQKQPLYVPYWLMNFEELAYFLVGAKSSDDARPEYRRLREKIVEMKKSWRFLGQDKNEITADSPVPFDVRELWYFMNYLVNATYDESALDKQIPTEAKVTEKGDSEVLEPAIFESYSIGAGAPYKSKDQVFYAYEKNIFTRLKDTRYDFMFHPGEYKDGSKDISNLLVEWLGNTERLTIFDLSNVPFEVLDITVGLITRVIYESMFWGRYEQNTGKNRPLLMVYEEAHSYLSDKDNSIYAKKAVERIFKEGRKFGVGSMVISQRPSELSETILSQVGTFIALRLTNSSDQGIVNSLAPDNMNTIIKLLPSLRIGEAIVIGEAIKIPTRVRIAEEFPRAASDDPELVKRWSEHLVTGGQEEIYEQVVKKMRSRKFTRSE
ncbi:ATP-binding protein [Enterococcus hirae]|uniref:ATP-binding protein n=1 Tax=Enterococcus hirae TaxID=1354 RepID=UPI0015F28F5F|nr:ATP-binding protein [Enterococcus hirae]MBA5268823.1 ATP-binding protein [Enterococcus hirae]